MTIIAKSTYMKIVHIAAIVILAGFTVSCVSSKKFKTLDNLYNTESQNWQQQSHQLNTRITELTASEARNLAALEALRKELDELRFEQEIVSRNRDILLRDKTNLESQLAAIQSGTSAEIEALMTELQRAREDLNLREDHLKNAERLLEERNSRLIELQDALRQQEEAVVRLRQTVANALTGFTNNGLSVFEKNGKVYVSLEEQLLFKSGQWQVDPRGQQALRDLGSVLAQNPEINVLVEGHTDHVPMRSSNQVRDNWDLSVMRATAVAKVLLENKSVDPARITAAGRSEYLPLDAADNSAARQKNRRTEIILTPRLDELLKLIEGN